MINFFILLFILFDKIKKQFYKSYSNMALIKISMAFFYLEYLLITKKKEKEKKNQIILPTYIHKMYEG